ncbi:hypothetical protein NDU88_001744 [Pleurodeles waltl]|uniref:Uncharacterized protein n=1 Tax=Pleurodeles waltl TaxID=8319 RepID=A0AAV7W0D2_PLEWA|nr:hypothetical protein NDU88_001744 [Pleurodeles waltl]
MPTPGPPKTEPADPGPTSQEAEITCGRLLPRRFWLLNGRRTAACTEPWRTSTQPHPHAQTTVSGAPLHQRTCEPRQQRLLDRRTVRRGIRTRELRHACAAERAFPDTPRNGRCTHISSTAQVYIRNKSSQRTREKKK